MTNIRYPWVYKGMIK